MRPILFFADRLPPLTGGMEMHARYFIEHFKTHPRFPVLAVVTRDEAGRDCLLQDESRAPVLLADLPRHLNATPSLVFFNSGRWIEDLPDIRACFPEAIFVYRTGGNEILKAPLERQRIEAHAARQALWVERLNSCIDLLITNSAFTDRRLLGLGIRPEKLRRCVGGVNLQALRALNSASQRATGTPTFFCASRFVPYKNHALMLDVLEALAQQGHNFLLRLAGDGPLLEKFRSRAQTPLLRECVQFMGRLSNEEVCREIVQADYYIQLSSEHLTEVPGGSYLHAEGMGRSILEALSGGTFVIAARSGALPEVVMSDRGILVELENPAEIVKQFALLLTNPPPRPLPFDDYGWDYYFASYEQLWEGLNAPATRH